MSEELRVTLHAHKEMTEQGILLSDVLRAISTGEILENYPDHRRGACCLLNGTDSGGSAIHVVCTTSGSMLIIVTVYLPLPPRWTSPTQRRTSQ